MDAAKDVAPEAEESQGVSADDAELEQLMHHEAALDTEVSPPRVPPRPSPPGPL